MTCTPFFKLQDFWIGFYWDQQKRILYWIPIIPCFGLKFNFDTKVSHEK